ncbi:MAG: hypothetical protein Q8P07_00415 [bacterium]|nr:hypothetical protein [bacterium]
MKNINKSKEHRLFIITGSSGVGKSTLIPLLKNSLDNNYDVRDFDENLTKKVAQNGALLDKWRRETTKYWIKKALNNSKTEKSTIIMGLVYPKEATEAKSEIPISFGLLDASDEKIAERLMGKRFSTPEKVAGLRRATNQSPEVFLKSNKLLMDRLRQEIRSVEGTIIDTTTDTPKQSAIKILNWLKDN